MLPPLTHLTIGMDPPRPKAKRWTVKLPSKEEPQEGPTSIFDNRDETSLIFDKLPDTTAKSDCGAFQEVAKLREVAKGMTGDYVAEKAQTFVQTLQLRELYLSLKGEDALKDMRNVDIINWWCTQTKKFWKEPVVEGQGKWPTEVEYDTAKDPSASVWMAHKPTVQLMLSRSHSRKYFEYVSAELKNDESIVRLALRKTPENLRFVNKSFFEKPEFIVTVLGAIFDIDKSTLERIRPDIMQWYRVLEESDEEHVQINADRLFYNVLDEKYFKGAKRVLLPRLLRMIGPGGLGVLNWDWAWV